ncbi:hypothetical protein BGZ60DRAFT_522209 [Tricladium varicosporioides]|nr:hypothetical protein BGZ60DRAFT_522209 [Hymenoscyphus varicosporioides]
MYSLVLSYAFLGLIRYAIATCNSYGIDFVDGGSYFIDSSSTANFTFLTDFSGCDSEEITPILVDPNEDEYFCSQIPTSPDLTSFLSTCPISQNKMFSGSWYVVIEGLEFAYVRTFTLTVGVPTTITATPTVTVGLTSTPDAVTETVTSTSTGSTILPTSTVTVPCQTIYFTKTEIPAPIFITSTYTVSLTITTGIVWQTSDTTTTSTATCTPPPFPRGQDPKLQHPLYLPHMTITPPSNWKARTPDAPRRHPVRDMTFKAARNIGIIKRGPDSATVTTTETTYSATTTSTTILTPSTVSETTVQTTINTITPTPVTKCRGITAITSTTTLPAHTYTRLKLTDKIILVDKTISLVHTKQSVTTPPAVATSCFNSGGWL